MNTDFKNIFRRQKKLIRHHILSTINKSQEYQGFENQLETILLLADRVLAAFEEHFEFNRIGEVAKTLVQVGHTFEKDKAELEEVTSLLQSIEQWLKALIWLVDRPKWHQLSSNKKKFTLFPCIRELGLLTQQELDLPEDQYQTIPDEVRRLIYWSLKDRNFITHETFEAPQYIQSRYLPAALLTLLAPIYKHQDTIKQNLRGLIISPTIKVQEVENLIRLIDGERRNHLHRFRGRQKWTTQLGERLLEDPQSQNPYLLLTGHEGLGKSALCAKLTEEIVSRNADFLGANATEIRKIAPWLPNILLHFGKQSNQPDEIVRLLIAQANTLLLDPIELSHPEQHRLQDVVARFNPAFEDNPMPAQAIANKMSYSDYREIQTPRFQPKATIPNIEQYRRVLYLALEKVAQEYGSIVLIIDAVDEISPDGTNLNFLPEHLPQGVSALLTARQNTQVVSWLANNRNIDRIRLTGLDKEEISLLTGIKDADGPDQAEFNEGVWKASQGWPVLVQAATKLIPEHRHDLSRIKVAQSADSVFERQAKEWVNISSPETNSETLLGLLRTLAIFEPVAPLDLEAIQAFFAYQQVDLSLADLRWLLQPVSTQLEGLSTGQVKLSLKAFAEYVRDRYCSRKDLERAIKTVVAWLSEDQDISAKILAAFLQYWTNPTNVRQDSHRIAASHLVDTLIARGNAAFLYNIFKSSSFTRQRRKKKSTAESFPRFAEQCLTAAAELGHMAAMRNLGDFLIEGNGLTQDQAKGQEWLYKAIQGGDIPSKTILGQHLLDGKEVPKNVIEGERLLREAADEEEAAKGILATRLLEGDGLPQNLAEGEQLLRELVDAGNQVAIVRLANLLLSGRGLSQDVNEGVDLLRQLADEDNKVATITLALHLLNKPASDQDTQEGLLLLRHMTDAGDIPAMILLSNYLLDQPNISSEQMQEGELLLRKAIDKDRQDAKFIYGHRLLHGNGLAKDPLKGQKILQELADIGHEDSMIALSNYLFDIENPEAGSKWLYKAVSSENSRAIAIL